MEKHVPEIPQIDIPDEVTHVNRPEIEETTPHPTSPNPQAEQRTSTAADLSADGVKVELPPIGFKP
ncbi:hypothetical protein LOK74_17215 [Brevibacillus humidisoli]|uniref:hypothetical protein n=1 Tax=Brevibacillus humidisoli TaxID=2895522 RepID=UPI001E5045DC|nr:hypothetical protein [Brevibacillus humidisoli]UFJ39778.1 hypothetical protein LOK74_17215 [Brevibacillus humidisoli]